MTTDSTARSDSALGGPDFMALPDGPGPRELSPSVSAVPASVPNAVGPDTFNGDTDHLRRSIAALLALDDEGALRPHGIGGHAHKLLTAAYHRLAD